MRLKLISRGIAALVGVAAVAMSVNGCATQDSELFIRAVADSPPGQCIVKPEADTQIRLVGTLDLAFGGPYYATLLWGNQLVERGSSDLVRTEVNRVALESADVSVQLTDGSEITSYSVPTSGFADPTVGGLPGFGLAAVPLIDFKSGRAAYKAGKRTLVSKVRLFGKTLGGSSVQSNQFTYVVEVCNGCLVNYKAVNNDPTAATGSPNCLAALNSTAMATSESAPCQLGHDYPIDCTLCLTSYQVCLTGPGAL